MKNYSCDVTVVGAGAAGIAAAVAAARLGKRVFLLEKNNFLGGEVVTGMHSYLCGLFFNNGPRLINAGIVKEIYDLLLERGAQEVNMGKVYALRFDNKDFIWAIKKITKQKNLKIFYTTSAVKPIVKGKMIIALLAQGKKGNIKINTKSVVDCSGAVIKKIKDAVLRDKGKKHLGGYCFKINANCRDELLGVKVAYCLREAVETRKLPWYFRLTQTTILNKQSAVIKMTMPYDSRHMRLAKKEGLRMFGYLRRNIDALKSGKIIQHGVLLERSGERLNAQTILPQGDVILGKKHLLNVAAKGAWPIEFWGVDGVEYAYCQKDYYDIPYGCLKAKNIKNLFSAGRFIGADVKALASVRVSGICLATGAAAGNLAAKAVQCL